MFIFQVFFSILNLLSLFIFVFFALRDWIEKEIKFPRSFSKEKRKIFRWFERRFRAEIFQSKIDVRFRADLDFVKSRRKKTSFSRDRWSTNVFYLHWKRIESILEFCQVFLVDEFTETLAESTEEKNMITPSSRIIWRAVNYFHFFFLDWTFDRFPRMIINYEKWEIGKVCLIIFFRAAFSAWCKWSTSKKWRNRRDFDRPNSNCFFFFSLSFVFSCRKLKKNGRSWKNWAKALTVKFIERKIEFRTNSSQRKLFVCRPMNFWPNFLRNSTSWKIFRLNRKICRSFTALSLITTFI